MLRCKYMQLNWIQSMKDPTPGINDDLGISISLDEKFVKKKKEEGKKLS